MAAAAAPGWSNARSAAGNRNPWLIAVVVSISAFMEVLDTSIANVALSHIAGGLATSYDEATWVLTAYLIANAIIIPASGWLSSVLGRKRYYMLSVALFTAASFMCGISSSLGMLVLSRILQGIGGGGLQPSTQSMLVDSFPPAQRAAAFGLFGLTVIMAPAIGPTLGGLITDNISWNWVFLINIPVGIGALALVNWLVVEPEAIKEESRQLKAGGLKFDLTGFILIAVGLGTLEVFADRGQQDNWFGSPLITICGVAAVLGLVGFVFWELAKEKDQLLDLRMLKKKNFAICNGVTMIMGVILFGTTQFVPQLLQQVLGYTATDSGLAMTTGGLATLVGLPIVSALSGKVQPKHLIAFALAVECLSLLGAATFNTDISFWDAALGRAWQAFAIPFLFIPLTAAAYVGLAPEKTNQASAMLNVFRNLGGTIGISSMQTLLAQREQFHQAHLVENLNPLNPVYVSTLTQLRGALVGPLGPAAADQGALAQLYQSVGRQAALLSYNDGFYALALFIGVVFPIAFFLRSTPKGGGGAAAA